MYVGVASLIATAHSLGTVTIGENGIMAINCPLTLGRAAGFSTRTAHPDVLRKMADLFGRVFQKGISIDNPLLMQTKAEVVKDLVKRAGAPIVKKTHSCWIARQAKHCGRCVPCVVRRFATEAAGVADVKYEEDIFSAPGPIEEDSFANIGDYLLFIRRLSMSTDDDLLFDYPDLNVSGDGDDLVAKLLKSHRKWASQVERVIKKYPALDSLY